MHSQSDILKVYQTESDMNCVDMLQGSVFKTTCSTKHTCTKGKFMCNSLTVCQHDFYMIALQTLIFSSKCKGQGKDGKHGIM